MHWRRKWQPTPIFLSGEFHGQKSLVSYSPRDHKEANTTENTLTQKEIDNKQTTKKTNFHKMAVNAFKEKARSSMPENKEGGHSSLTEVTGELIPEM